MRNMVPILLITICLALATLIARATSPQAVQLCPISSNTFAVPSKGTDLLRTLNASNIQQCVAYSNLTSDLKLYGGNPHAWQTPAALGIQPYQSVVPPVAPPVTPPAVATQTVVITSADNPQLVVSFTGIPTPGCFTINTKSVCVP